MNKLFNYLNIDFPLCLRQYISDIIPLKQTLEKAKRFQDYFKGIISYVTTATLLILKDDFWFIQMYPNEINE